MRLLRRKLSPATLRHHRCTLGAGYFVNSDFILATVSGR